MTASKLLIKPNIRAALDKGFAERRLRTQVTGDGVTLQLARIAFGNLAVMFNERGRLKHLHDLPLDVQVVIGSIEVVTKRTVSKGQVIDVEYVHKIRARDAVRALEHLAKHLGLFNAPPLDLPDVPVFALPPGCLGVSAH